MIDNKTLAKQLKKIITMQETKKELINQVMEGDFKEGSFLSSLSKEEIQRLFE